MNEKILKQYEKALRNFGIKIVITLICVMLIVWSGTAVEFNEVSSNGLKIAKNIFLGIFNPDKQLLFNFTTAGVAYLLLETICIAFLGTLVGAILAIPFAFISATNIVPKFLSVIGRFIIMAIRTVPSIVYALMFIRVTGPGPFAGLLTMSLSSIGMISKMYIESIEDLDTKILESLDACGCNFFQKIRYGILPQLFSDFISTVIYRFDMNLRDASVLGIVGAGGIGAPLIFAMNAYRWSEVGSIIIGLIVLVLIIEFFSTKIRVKLARG